MTRTASLSTCWRRSASSITSQRRYAMVFKVGERVSEHARSTARHGRSGEVREVLGGDIPPYPIRWGDGPESIYTPPHGALKRPPPAAPQGQPAGRNGRWGGALMPARR